MSERRTRLPNRRRPSRPRAGSQNTPPEGARHTPRGERTRARLLTAGREIFERHGFLQARIADICETADVAYGSFYRYFDSKEELFGEIVTSAELDIHKALLAQAQLDLPNLIRYVIRLYLQTYSDNARLMAVLREVTGFDAEFRSRQIDQYDRVIAMVEERLKALGAEGRVDPEVDPTYAAHALIGMVVSFAERLQRGTGILSLEETTEQVTRICSNALRMSG